ncbi:hypothetical protein PTKU46_23390 [Paraburkholderia terrae]
MPMIFDDESRAEMLCYLVVGELVAMAGTGDWLKTDHLVELSRIWLHANGAQFEWQERINIARIAAEFAPDVLATIELRTKRHWRRYLLMAAASTTVFRSSVRFTTVALRDCDACRHPAPCAR